jgi:uncharacterized protein YjgD (DUF1641 family)
MRDEGYTTVTSVVELDQGAIGTLLEGLSRIDDRLGRIEHRLEIAEMRSDSLSELSEDLMPMVNGIFAKASDKLTQLEHDGALDFAREGLNVLETVATSFDEEDVRLLGRNIVGILRTIRNLTQKDVLDVADRAAVALAEEPAGKVGLVRSMRDPDVRRGMNILIRVLREIGQENETKGEDASE